MHTYYPTLLRRLCALLMLFSPGLMVAQTAREVEEVKVEQYIKQHLRERLPVEFHTLEDEGREAFGQLSASEQASVRGQWARNYWRMRYFQEHPEAWHAYRGGEPAPICENGDFEDGLAGYAGDYGEYSTGECAAPNTVAFTPLAGPIGTETSQIMLTSNTPDPIITSIGQTNAGSVHAVRINSPKGSETGCYPDQGINKLRRDIVLTSVDQEIGFFFALVLENPEDHVNRQPFFSVRALNADDVVLDEFCRIADASSSFFDTYIGPYTSDGCPDISTTEFPVVFAPWDCNRLNVSGAIGDVITLEFIASDCGAGAHWGYAYVDDICAVCDSPATGLVQLDPYQGCIEDTVQICGTYVPPVLDGVFGTADAFMLHIEHDGVNVTVGTPTWTHDPVAHTFCFQVSTANFPAIDQGYDFHVFVDFSYDNTEDDVNTTPGPNNDIFLGTACCTIDTAQNLSCDYVSGGESGTILLDWADVFGAIDYEIEIITFSQDCCPGNTGVSETFVIPATDQISFLYLPNAGFYPCATWRVRAECASGEWSEWTEPQCLCYTAPCALAAPIGLKCSHAASPGVGGTANLTWNGYTIGSTYEIQVNTFSSMCCPGTLGTPQTFTFTSTTNAYNLTNAGYYPCARWRVREHCYGEYWGPWSTYTCLCSPVYCSATAPTGTTCSNVNNTITLGWTAVPWAMQYEVSIRTHACGGCTPTGTSVTYTYTTNNNVFTLPQPLGYYPCGVWRVRVKCANGSVSAFTSPLCFCGNSSGCTDLLANWNLNGAASSGPLTSCATGLIPPWKPFMINYPTPNSRIYAPLLNGVASDQYLNFPNSINPSSWDASAMNLRYTSFKLDNVGFITAETDGRAGIWQSMSPAMVNGAKYFLRVRYAAYTNAGASGSTFNLTGTLGTSTACPPSASIPNMQPVNVTVTPANSLGALTWNALTIPFTANSGYTTFFVQVSPTGPNNLKANTRVMFYLDDVEIVRYDCRMDLDGNGLIGVGDIQILIGYVGMNVNQILNLCHAGADANNDGVVTQADVDLFMAAFGTICGGGMVQGEEKLLDEAIENSLSAQPNPNTGRFVVTHRFIEAGMLEVLSAKGEVVARVNATGDHTEVDLGRMPAGLYLVRLLSNGVEETMRVIKE